MMFDKFFKNNLFHKFLHFQSNIQKKKGNFFFNKELIQYAPCLSKVIGIILLF